ncbi:MAG: GNAT family N-acetyltransferase [Acidobacteria bacterium]|nr:GNAT family N-acetyltransferase [Acidobacteriota bacterium]
MIIRKAERSDASSLVDFNQKMALETEGKTLDTAILTNGVTAVFSDQNKGFYVVAEDQGSIVGGLMVTFEWSDWRNKWFWWIQSVYIVPEARGKGVYRLLYDFVKSEATKRGNVCGYRLYVEQDNENAQRVYEKVGMKNSIYFMYEEY